MSRFDVTTVGETMLRISTRPGTPLRAATGASLYPAGAESNVASALAGLGRRVSYATRLPDNAPGQLIGDVLRGCGVDLSMVRWCEVGRVGTFFVELEQPPTPVRVTYDRAGSCATEMSPGEIDWARLLDTRLLHLTGITPALSAACRETIDVAIDRAREAGVAISFDVNYRAKLWSAQQAREALTPMLQDVELLFIGESDARDVFGITGTPESVLDGLVTRFGAEHIILTVGGGGVVAWRDGQIVRQPAQPTHIIDRLGAGDALAAGVIHGWLEGDFALGLRAGVALAAKALRTEGDIIRCSIAELTTLLNATSDRPQR
jgi:2-dehydro-3-deoxygluconokinase